MDKQHILRMLEKTVIELNHLYKYTYTEDELIKLNKYYSIEEIDETKDEIDTNLFILIIETVLKGATPFNKTVYKIIKAYSDVLNLKEFFADSEWQQFNTIISNIN